MATIVNNPPPSENSNSGGPIVMIVALVVLLILAYVVFVYGIPALKRVGSPQINVPNKVDVNVHQTK